MFNLSKNNKTLQPRRKLINNDIDVKEYNLTYVSIIVMGCVMFLLYTQLLIIIGTA